MSKAKRRRLSLCSADPWFSKGSTPTKTTDGPRPETHLDLRCRLVHSPNGTLASSLENSSSSKLSYYLLGGFLLHSLSMLGSCLPSISCSESSSTFSSINSALSLIVGDSECSYSEDTGNSPLWSSRGCPYCDLLNDLVGMLPGTHSCFCLLPTK